MAAALATAQLTALIPVVTTAGIAWKMTQSMFPGQQQQSQPARRRRPKKDVYDRGYFGNFSNIGW